MMMESAVTLNFNQFKNIECHENYLFDQILKHLYENPSKYWVIDALAKQHFSVTDKQLLESIIDELLERKWGTRVKDSKWSIKITFEGRQIIDKHGSYSSFLKSLAKVERKC
jgi:hypothetical protein